MRLNLAHWGSWDTVIYICEHEESKQQNGNLKTIRADGHLRYEYSGQGDASFIPKDVCTDQMGHVLICTYLKAHILDKDGQFIQCILTYEQGFNLYHNIDIDNEGNVWVGEDSRYIKVVKYLQ